MGEFAEAGDEKPFAAFIVDSSALAPQPVQFSGHMTMSRALQTVAAWKGNAPAITSVGPSGRELVSFRQLDMESNRLARAYQAYGAKRNDLIVVASPSPPEVAAAAFACWKLGATPVNVGSTHSFRELDELVRLANPKLVIGFPTLKDPTMELSDRFICLPEGFTPGPFLSCEPLPEAYASSWLVATSGGSTGKPKLIVLNEPSIVRMQDLGGGKQVMANGFATDGGGVTNGVDLIPCPLSHNAPFYCAMQGILSASHQVLLTKFDAEQMLALVQEYRATFSYAVPTIMKRVWDLPEAVRLSYDVSSLQGVFHMGAPCPAWLKEGWCSWLGPEKIWECYGATEAQAYTMIRGDEWLARHRFPTLNLVGRPAVGDMQIRDPETKTPLPPGTIGEVWMRHHERRQTYYYRGALALPDPNGWETVGDMGMLDEDGYLHLGDRKADMVIIGGINIYPAEVESVLEHHPHVRSAVVVGVKDADLGSSLHAIVYTGKDNVSSEELRAYAEKKLARVKVPRAFSFATSHLRSDDGKVRRTQVAESFLAPVATSGSGHGEKQDARAESGEVHSMKPPKSKL